MVIMSSINENQELDNGLLYKLILFNAILSCILLITILKPHRLYKTLLSKILKIEFTFHGANWQIYHVLFLVIAFWIVLYIFLKLQASAYQPDKFDSYIIKMGKLDKKWLIEMEIWLTFLIITCYISLYVNSIIFTKENELKKKIEEKEKQIAEAKNQKN